MCYKNKYELILLMLVASLVGSLLAIFSTNVFAEQHDDDINATSSSMPSIQGSPNRYMKNGEQDTLQLNLCEGAESVGFYSGDPNVAVVDQNTGVVTAVGPGQTTITAKTKLKDDNKVYESTCNVTVTGLVAKEITIDSCQIYINGTLYTENGAEEICGSLYKNNQIFDFINSKTSNINRKGKISDTQRNSKISDIQRTNVIKVINFGLIGVEIKDSIRILNGGKIDIESFCSVEIKGNIKILNDGKIDMKGSSRVEVQEGVNINVCGNIEVQEGSRFVVHGNVEIPEIGHIRVEREANLEIAKYGSIHVQHTGSVYILEDGEINVYGTFYFYSAPTFRVMGKLNISEGANFYIQGGSSFTVWKGGTVNVNEYANLHIQSGSELMLCGTLNVKIAATCIVEEDSELEVRVNGKAYICGEVKVLEKGNIYVMGYIEIQRSNTILDTDIHRPKNKGGDIEVQKNGKIEIHNAGTIRVDVGTINIQKGGKFCPRGKIRICCGKIIDENENQNQNIDKPSVQTSNCIIV